MKTLPEEFKTYKNVFDQFTIKNIFKLMTQGHFEGLESPISIGKEANIFSARTKEGDLVVVKIYRLMNCDFNKMYNYMKIDPRYMDIKKSRRNVVFAWAQREYRNLFIAREAKVRVPQPRAVLANSIVIEFIGENTPAPKVKDELPENMAAFAQETIANIKKLYGGNLVHGDLSEFNILNLKERPVFIDFSQAIPKNAMNAKELLVRDIKNIVRFFGKHGVRLSLEEVSAEVTRI